MEIEQPDTQATKCVHNVPKPNENTLEVAQQASHLDAARQGNAPGHPPSCRPVRSNRHKENHANRFTFKHFIYSVSHTVTHLS